MLRQAGIFIPYVHISPWYYKLQCGDFLLPNKNFFSEPKSMDFYRFLQKTLQSGIMQPFRLRPVIKHCLTFETYPWEND